MSKSLNFDPEKLFKFLLKFSGVNHYFSVNFTEYYKDRFYFLNLSSQKSLYSSLSNLCPAAKLGPWCLCI